MQKMNSLLCAALILSMSGAPIISNTNASFDPVAVRAALDVCNEQLGLAIEVVDNSVYKKDFLSCLEKIKTEVEQIETKINALDQEIKATTQDETKQTLENELATLRRNHSALAKVVENLNAQPAQSAASTTVTEEATSTKASNDSVEANDAQDNAEELSSGVTKTDEASNDSVVNETQDNAVAQDNPVAQDNTEEPSTADLTEVTSTEANDVSTIEAQQESSSDDTSHNEDNANQE